MSTLLEYIETLKKPQKVRIKLACQCPDEAVDKLEKYLERYDAVEITAPQKLILQKQPLDFPHLDKAEIHIIDFTANLPVSLQLLHSDVARIMRTSEGNVVVRRPDDQREQENQDKKEEYKPRLSTTGEFHKEELPEQSADELYGDKYNTNLLKELKKLADERKQKLETPKVVDPDVPATEPQIGDGPGTNKKSPVRAFTSPTGKGK